MQSMTAMRLCSVLLAPWLLWGGEGETAAPATARWVYHGDRKLKSDEDLEFLIKLVDRASAAGLNGLVLNGDLDRISLWPKERVARLEQLKAHCAARKVALIPCGLSAGYAGGTLAHDQNLAAGLPVRDVEYVVKDGRALLVPAHPVSHAQGSFEKTAGDRVEFFDKQDAPGERTFVDRSVAHEGKASLRMEAKGGHVRVMKRIEKPYRHYLVRFQARAAGMEVPEATLCLYKGEDQLNRANFALKADGSWTACEFTFCTLGEPALEVWFGLWGKEKGTLWLDDLEIVEPGMVNLLRRPATPLSVARAEGGEAYREGEDYLPLADPRLDPKDAWHEPPELKVKEGSRIKDGEHLKVSYYTTAFVKGGHQKVVCLSDPKVYEIWKETVSRLAETLKPAYWLLDMDEVRAFCQCEICRNRKAPDGLPMLPAQVLGDCVTRQAALIREHAPRCQVAVWNDMFDPNHNAQTPYFLVPGGFAGSWKYLPKDLWIVCWSAKHAGPSAAHFAALGYGVVGAPQVVAKLGLDVAKLWQDVLKGNPAARGLLYITYTDGDPYKDLEAFGKLAAEQP